MKYCQLTMTDAAFTDCHNSAKKNKTNIKEVNNEMNDLVMALF